MTVSASVVAVPAAAHVEMVYKPAAEGRNSYQTLPETSLVQSGPKAGSSTVVAPEVSTVVVLNGKGPAPGITCRPAHVSLAGGAAAFASIVATKNAHIAMIRWVAR